MYYYIAVEGGKVIGCQVTPQEILSNNLIEVTSEDYNKVTALGPYETMTWDGSKLHHIPDPRPSYSVSGPSIMSIGESKSITFTGGTGIVLADYSAPGRVGLCKLTFEDGVADWVFTPTTSGYYTFGGGEKWRAVDPLSIAVIE